MTLTPLGRNQDCSLKIREPDVPASWFLDLGGWSKMATVNLYFIFPGICTLSLNTHFINFFQICVVLSHDSEISNKRTSFKMASAELFSEFGDFCFLTLRSSKSQKLSKFKMSQNLRLQIYSEELLTHPVGLLIRGVVEKAPPVKPIGVREDGTKRIKK
ncbi:hypothetical protein STEG23_036474 [Scotinomys teguina]